MRPGACFSPGVKRSLMMKEGPKCPYYQRLHETREEEYLCIRNLKSADCMKGADMCFYTIWGCKLLKLVIIENETLFRKESHEITCLS